MNFMITDNITLKSKKSKIIYSLRGLLLMSIVYAFKATTGNHHNKEKRSSQGSKSQFMIKGEHML